MEGLREKTTRSGSWPGGPLCLSLTLPPLMLLFILDFFPSFSFGSFFPPLCFCNLNLFCLIFLIPFFSYSLSSLPIYLPPCIFLIGCCSQCPSKKDGQSWWWTAHGPSWVLSQSDPLQALSSQPSLSLAQSLQCCQHHWWYQQRLLDPHLFQHLGLLALFCCPHCNQTVDHSLRVSCKGARALEGTSIWLVRLGKK